MEWTFEMVESPGFIRVVTSGDFCSRAFGRMMDELTQLEYWRAGMPLLVDHRRLRLAEADPVVILAASDEFVRRGSAFAFAPVAILYDSPEAIEVADRYGEITDDRSLAEVRRFMNESEAIEWLTSQVSPAA